MLINKIYIDFLKSLPYYYKLDNFIFVHAGFNDDIKDPFADQYSMIWFSNDTYKNSLLSDRIIIHGHNPITRQKCRENILMGKRVIGIDTGYVYSGTPGYGYLTAIEINSMEIYHYKD